MQCKMGLRGLRMVLLLSLAVTIFRVRDQAMQPNLKTIWSYRTFVI